MNVDPRSHIPIYLQIADGIRAAVAAGLYRPGEALPSLRALAIDVQVNPNTVQRAYDQLERDGLIYSQRGKGLFVAQQGTTSAKTRSQQVVRRGFDETGFAKTIIVVDAPGPFIGTIHLDALPYENVTLSDYYPYGVPPQRQ